MKKSRSRQWAGFVTLTLFGCVLSGCDSKSTRYGLPGERVQLDIKDQKIDAEVACDALSAQQGLMHREHLPEDAGMLFIFPRREQRSFWMRNTLIPLSVAFLDDNGEILQIEDMRPKDETRIRSKTMVRYALEVNQGWFTRHGIEVGDTFADFQQKVRHFRAS